MADCSNSQFAQVIGGQGRQNGGVDGVLTKRGLVSLKAEGAKPHAHVERGAWNRAGGHDEWRRNDQPAEAHRLVHQDVEVLGARAVIVDRRAQTILTMHGGVRHAGDPFLLKSKHDLGVERLERRGVSAVEAYGGSRRC